MQRFALGPWILLAAVIGITVGTGLYALPQVWMVSVVLLAVLSFATAWALIADEREPARWRARTVGGRRFVIHGDVERVLEVAGAALEGAGVHRLERWPSELIASRDSLGGSEHVEVRCRTVDGLVHVDVRARSQVAPRAGDGVVERVVSALESLHP